VEKLRPALDAAAADWIRPGVRGFAESVLSLVPDCFSANVRVFHPYRRQLGSGLRWLSWGELADASGATTHAGMQLNRLVGFEAMNREPGARTGTLPPELRGDLARVLGEHTATSNRCWFAVWDGFGGLADEVRQGATFELPHRIYHLLVGPLDALPELEWGPNLMWPEDRAWCLATEIDLDSSYVGCDVSCADELVASAGLEALAIDPATGIDFESDVLNQPREPNK
jgi:hypothetical protein